MARQLRIEFEGAIYHVMARGNRRENIVQDDVDSTRYSDLWKEAVDRAGWNVYEQKQKLKTGSPIGRWSNQNTDFPGELFKRLSFADYFGEKVSLRALQQAHAKFHSAKMK